MIIAMKITERGCRNPKKVSVASFVLGISA